MTLPIFDMDLYQAYVWLLFVLCLALTCGGILSLFRFPDLKKLSAYKYLVYFLILFYVFGYYGIWSTIFMDSFIAIELKQEGQVLKVMSGPFLIAGLLMMIGWVNSLLRKRLSTVILFLIMLLITSISTFLYASNFSMVNSMVDLYQLLAIGIWLMGCIMMGFVDQEILSNKVSNMLMVIMFLLSVLHIAYLLRFDDEILQRPLLIFLLFVLSTSLAVIFVYNASVLVHLVGGEFTVTLDKFTNQYHITIREKEVIEEMYKGKSNQEIADSLFISLQTVKDHTSRIYLKTHMRNRVQLINAIKMTRDS